MKYARNKREGIDGGKERYHLLSSQKVKEKNIKVIYLGRFMAIKVNWCKDVTKDKKLTS